MGSRPRLRLGEPDARRSRPRRRPGPQWRAEAPPRPHLCPQPHPRTVSPTTTPRRRHGRPAVRRQDWNATFRPPASGYDRQLGRRQDRHQPAAADEGVPPPIGKPGVSLAGEAWSHDHPHRRSLPLVAGQPMNVRLITERRIAAGLTVRQLADQLGLNAAVLRRLEDNLPNDAEGAWLSVATLSRICTALDLDVSERSEEHTSELQSRG